MKHISDELKAHYAESSTTLSLCWRATLRDGTIFGATNAQTELIIDGVTYSPLAGFTQTDVESGSQLAPDNLEVEGFLQAPSIDLEDIHSGRWDNAKIDLFEVNRANPAMGARLLRCGTLGDVRASRDSFTAEFRGLLQQLNKNVVRITTQQCNADLGDSRCKVDLAPFTVTGTITSVVNSGEFTDTSRTEVEDWFSAGKLTMTSGANAGYSMEVKHYTAGGTFKLYLPLYFEVEVGDTYSVYAGCQKRFTQDCKNKFNNVLNFRGFPHVPQNKIYKRGDRQGSAD